MEKGFIPSTDEERLMISPPLSNLEVGNWNNKDNITHCFNDVNQYYSHNNINNVLLTDNGEIYSYDKIDLFLNEGYKFYNEFLPDNEKIEFEYYSTPFLHDLTQYKNTLLIYKNL